MAEVELRDIVTGADRRRALGVRRWPGQGRFVSSVKELFRDAVRDSRARPRFWTVEAGGELVGFVMISDGIPADVLAEHQDLIGPYFLWRLLIDREHQRSGYGTATLDAVVEYVRGRPGADALYTSAGQGKGSPQPFYERYGFVSTGDLLEGEVVLRLDLTSPPTSVDTLAP